MHWRIPSAKPGRKSHRPQNGSQFLIPDVCGWGTKKSRFWLLLARVHRSGLLGQYFHAAGLGIDHSHFLPVICEFFAAPQTHKIGSSDGSDLRPLLALAAGNERGTFLVTAPENLGPCHLN